MIYLCTRSYMPNPTGSLDITIRLGVEQNFYTASMFLMAILQKHYPIKLHNFSSVFLGGRGFRRPCNVIYSYNKNQWGALFFKFIFDKEVHMFWTDLLSIIRSLNAVYTVTGICHASYVDCLLERSGWSSILTSLADSQHN
jgi:hypothetical protein